VFSWILAETTGRRMCSSGQCGVCRSVLSVVSLPPHGTRDPLKRAYRRCIDDRLGLFYPGNPGDFWQNTVDKI